MILLYYFIIIFKSLKLLVIIDTYFKNQIYYFIVNHCSIKIKIKILESEFKEEVNSNYY